MNGEVYEIIKAVANKLELSGGEAYFVGGCVRDKIMGLECKDFDIEVHAVSADALQKILDDTAAYSKAGKSYGIYSLSDYPVDFALARKDTVRGKGHRDFDVEILPFIGKYDAAKRRDFTINSIMKNILTGEIYDPFGGVDDINNKIIRHTNSETYFQDPLRILRAAEFASRFCFEIADETIKLSRRGDISVLSKERVFEKTSSALLKSKKPSVFFNSLKEMHQLSFHFKEIDALSSEEQKKLLGSLDTAALYKDGASSPLGFMLAVICSHIKSTPSAKALIKRLTDANDITSYILNMHTQLPLALKAVKESSGVYETNKLFDNTIDKEGLILLLKSVTGLDSKEESFLQERLSLYNSALKEPDITGKDLIREGFSAGKNFSQMLSLSHDMKLRGYQKEEIISALKTEFNKSGM